MPSFSEVAGGYVVGVAFAAAGLFENLLVGQVRLPKWFARRMPASRADALDPQPMLKGISLWSLRWRRGGQDAGVGKGHPCRW